MTNTRSNNTNLSRSGVTLTEVLVVFAMVLILVMLITPVIETHREHARSVQCADNLRALGVAFHTFADRDPSNRLCTGAFDYHHDGCPDSWGWVSDVIKVGGSSPLELRCPANPVRGCETLNDLLAAASPDPRDGLPVTRQADGFCGEYLLGSKSKIANYAPGSKDRIDLVARQVSAGYNTNYASSWYMVRTDIDAWNGYRPDLTTDRTDPSAPKGSQRYLGLDGTRGPIRQPDLACSDYPANWVPLLGDMARHEQLVADLGGDLTKGTPLGQAHSPGPSTWNGDDLELLSDGVPVWDLKPKEWFPEVGIIVSDSRPPGRSPEGDEVHPVSDYFQAKLWLQDTRCWAAVHGRRCNLLMADASVKSVIDRNGDGFLNPGFPAGDSKTYATAQQRAEHIGYTDGRVELHPAEVLSFALIATTRYTAGGVGEH